MDQALNLLIYENEQQIIALRERLTVLEMQYGQKTGVARVANGELKALREVRRDDLVGGWLKDE
jgi:hypothetical protein